MVASIKINRSSLGDGQHVSDVVDAGYSYPTEID
jgi:hypothetical protein